MYIPTLTDFHNKLLIMILQQKKDHFTQLRPQ